MKKKRKQNGVKLFIISTAILFTAVFFMSGTASDKNDEKNISKPAESEGSVSESAVSETLETDIPSGEEGVSDTLTETTEEPREPKPDPTDADNTWAMFLVNSKNQVPAEYCDGIETDLVYESWREYYLDSRAAEYMKQMIKAAEEDGIQLVVMSAYRSVEYQQNNFDKSVQDRIDNRGMTYEEAYADTLKEVQLPGYSEHNAGVAADIMSNEETSMEDDRFKNTKAYAWLQENAADYGFILRYPEGKEDVTGIIYEPWHYRFVGVYYAKLLSDKGVTLEEYFEEMNWVDEVGKAVYHLPTLE
ncbi:MAG: M15 family metallopeptidase [Oscillospiraceae bacterium]|nr:M15 family metallopeptidase [Oscillospiraceae bacterium]